MTTSNGRAEQERGDEKDKHVDAMSSVAECNQHLIVRDERGESVVDDVGGAVLRASEKDIRACV